MVVTNNCSRLVSVNPPWTSLDVTRTAVSSTDSCTDALWICPVLWCKKKYWILLGFLFLISKSKKRVFSIIMNFTRGNFSFHNLSAVLSCCVAGCLWGRWLHQIDPTPVLLHEILITEDMICLIQIVWNSHETHDYLITQASLWHIAPPPMVYHEG